MAQAKNVLWIMCDQLRFDYLGCYGHPYDQDPEHRCDGEARRSLQSRLRAVADLRSLAHELLHRPLHALARLALERMAACGSASRRLAIT